MGHSMQLDMDKMRHFGERLRQTDQIDPDLYRKYEVKRGLRDLDGRGVLVGLTEIGEVRSYIVEENEMIPIPGKLMYRGINVEKIVDGFLSEGRYGFEETTFLLLFGALPTKQELTEFNELLGGLRTPPEDFVRDMILKMPSRDIMNALTRSTLAYYTYDETPDDTSIENVLRQCLILIAGFPAMAVYAYQALAHYHGSQSLFIHSPKPELSTAENILHMLRPDSQYTQLEATLLDLALVLHAEHGGGNNSSFVTHVVTSSGSDTYSTIAAALGSLKGPRHGGANIKVMQMFDDLKENVKDWKDDEAIEDYLMKVLNKQAFDKAGLIYGIGHAVYSISDPRALIFKDHVEKLARANGMDEEYELYAKVERLGPEIISRERKMYKGVSANVDFYSGFVYRMLGIPMELFTPLFAISRIAGWSAHRIEELVNNGKIIRPAYKSVATKTAYVPLEDRPGCVHAEAPAGPIIASQ